MQAILALEDGRIFSGLGYGHPGECQGEVVFNTSLTGYQEIATDPSYAGQIVVLTNPQIGNYGTNHADNEAAKPFIEGLIVREFSAIIIPPQSSILAVGAARRQAVENANGGIAFASVLSVTLSCDHRVIDGALGAELLASFKHMVEQPVAMLV